MTSNQRGFTGHMASPQSRIRRTASLSLERNPNTLRAGPRGALKGASSATCVVAGAQRCES